MKKFCNDIKFSSQLSQRPNVHFIFIKSIQIISIKKEVVSLLLFIVVVIEYFDVINEWFTIVWKSISAISLLSCMFTQQKKPSTFYQSVSKKTQTETKICIVLLAACRCFKSNFIIFSRRCSLFV